MKCFERDGTEVVRAAVRKGDTREPGMSTLGFAGEIVRGVWTAAGGALLQGSPYGAYQATKLLVTEPGEFFGQYVDAWDTAVDVAEAWWDTAGSTIDVPQGDKSISDHISDATHSSLLAHIGTSWDERDGDALGSTWFNVLGIAAGFKGLKSSVKPTPVTPRPVVAEVVVPAKIVESGAGSASAATTLLTPEVMALAEEHLTGSGTTVLGRFPAYIASAEARGASYFDIGVAWDALPPAQRTVANNHFLDVIASKNERVLVSTPKGEISASGALADEILYLTTEKGYKWTNQWSLRPGG